MTTDNGEAIDGFINALLDDDAEQLYDRAPCGYLSTLPDGTIIKVNQTFLALTGYRREDLVSHRHFADLLSPGGKIYHETHYEPMLRMHGVVREIALDLVLRDGSRLPVLMNSVLERDANGAPTVIRTAVFDARQRRQYEAELLKAKQRAEASEEHAVALARTLQQTLIPPTLPVIARLDVAAEYRPAGDGTEVGGDFYDIFQRAPNDWVVVIGDVCGKGVDAAVVTALARYTLRAAAIEDPSPAHALAVLNEVLRKHETERFCTVSVLRLQRTDEGWTGQLGCGGHPLPWLRSTSGALRRVGEAGSLLGVLEDPDLPQRPLDLEPGEVLVLYTDGVPEGRRGKDFYGEGRIAAIVAESRSTAQDLATDLLSDVLEFQGGIARDDIAIVVVRVPLPS